MPTDPPDFEQIARQLLEDLPDAFLTRGASPSSAVPGVAEALRQVWNAALDGVLRGLRSERDTDQMRAVIASVEFMKKS